MNTVGILVFYNGSWVHKDNIESYEGGEAKGIIVSWNHLRVEDNDDVQYFLKYNTDVMTSKVTPLLETLKIIEGHGIEGCNGIVSIESSNPPLWKDWVEDVNFESVENIVANLCVTSNEEETYSMPNVHPH
ncbi:unnamed protein product [Prunus armeniaca]